MGTQELEHQYLAVMPESYCHMVGVTLLDEHAWVESIHLGNDEHTDAAREASSHRHYLALGNVGS